MRSCLLRLSLPFASHIDPSSVPRDSASCKYAQRARRAISDRKAAEHVPEGHGTDWEDDGGRARVARCHTAGVRRASGLLRDLCEQRKRLNCVVVWLGLRDQRGALTFFRALPVPKSNIAALSSRVPARPTARFDISRLRRLGSTEDLKAAEDYWNSGSHKVLEAHRGGGRVRKFRDEGTKERKYEMRRVSFR